MNFAQWIKQAYGVDSDDHTARFTVYNMEVAYAAGKESITAQHQQPDICRLEKEIQYKQTVICHLLEKLKEKE